MRAGRRALLAALALTLAGCASWALNGVHPGDPQSEVIAKFGQPTARYPAENGMPERWQYSLEPSGREVWNVDIGANDRVLRVEQALQEGLYPKRIKAGVWTPADALREYGKPAYTEQVHNFHGTIWVYRYENGPFWRLLYLDITPNGIVQSYSMGDEYLPDDGPGSR